MTAPIVMLTESDVTSLQELLATADAMSAFTDAPQPDHGLLAHALKCALATIAYERAARAAWPSTVRRVVTS